MRFIPRRLGRFWPLRTPLWLVVLVYQNTAVVKTLEATSAGRLRPALTRVDHVDLLGDGLDDARSREFNGTRGPGWKQAVQPGPKHVEVLDRVRLDERAFWASSGHERDQELIFTRRGSIASFHRSSSGNGVSQCASLCQEERGGSLHSQVGP